MVLTKWTTSTIQWLSGQKAEIRLNETLTNYQKERYMIMNYYFKNEKKRWFTVTEVLLATSILR